MKQLDDSAIRPEGIAAFRRSRRLAGLNRTSLLPAWLSRPPSLLEIAWWIVALLAALALWAATAPARAGVPELANHYRRDYVRIVRSEWGLDAPVASLAAQIHQESGWDCHAISSAGAKGCAQFMPATAKWIGEVDHRLAGGDLSSPDWGFRAQAVYMRNLHERVKAANPCERMAFAMSAYNGGLGWVYRRQKLSKAPSRCFSATCEINPGIAAASQRENARYPRRILLELEPLYEGLEWGPGVCGRS